MEYIIAIIGLCVYSWWSNKQEIIRREKQDREYEEEIKREDMLERGMV